ncbi:MAG: serine hydrolase [Myxococcota bacterium]
MLRVRFSSPATIRVPLRAVRHGLPILFGALVVACSPSQTREVRTEVRDPVFDALSREIGDGAYGEVKAVIAAQAGRVLFEEYYGGNDAETRVDVRSVGKSITALAVGAAIDDGHLDGVEVRVWDYLTEGTPVPNDHPLKRSIDIGDLLSMSSPLECNDWVSSSAGNEERMYATDDWTDFALGLPVDPAYREVAEGQGRFSYCTAGAFLLGRVVERAVGVPFDIYVEERIFAPLGIEGVQWRRSPAGEAQSGGQLRMRARDLLALGQMIFSPESHTVSTDWLRLMLTPKVGATPEMNYGFLWWSRFFGGPQSQRHAGVFMLGNGGNIMLLLPDVEAVVVVQATNYNHPDAFEWTTNMVSQGILPHLESNVSERQ